MRRIYIWLAVLYVLLFVFINFFVTTPCYAYSFIEFPLLSNDDRLKGADIIFTTTENGITNTYYLTSQSLPTLQIFDYGCYFSNTTCRVYKLVNNEFWEVQLWNGAYGQQVTLICSNVTIDVGIYDYDYNYTTTTWWANSSIPSVNYQQLQLQESKSINSKISESNSFLLSIYVFLAFAITVSIGGFVIYIILKPLFYFIR